MLAAHLQQGSTASITTTSQLPNPKTGINKRNLPFAPSPPEEVYFQVWTTQQAATNNSEEGMNWADIRLPGLRTLRLAYPHSTAQNLFWNGFRWRCTLQ